MTVDEAKNASAVLNAFAGGKEIQLRRRNSGDWIDVKAPRFNFMDAEYRVKPEKKVVPFTFDDRNELIGKAVVALSGAVALIIRVNKGGVVIGGEGFVTFNILRLGWKFIDGSPCGKEVEG